MNKSSAITSQPEPARASAPEAYHEEDREGSNLSIENKQALEVEEEDQLIGETLLGKYLIEEAHGLLAGARSTRIPLFNRRRED